MTNLTFSGDSNFKSKENIKEVEKIKTELNKKDQDQKKEAKSILEKIQNKVYEIKKLSTENKELYGSVKPTEISKLLSEKEKLEINPSMIPVSYTHLTLPTIYSV